MGEARSKGPLRCRSPTVRILEGVSPMACLIVPLSINTTSRRLVMESLSFCWAWNRLGRDNKIRVTGKNLMDRSLSGSGFAGGRYKDKYLPDQHDIKSWPGHPGPHYSVSSPEPFGGRLCQKAANMDPVTFIKGPKTAGASPMVAILPKEFAMPEANPPFCIPTSIE